MLCCHAHRGQRGRPWLGCRCCSSAWGSGKSKDAKRRGLFVFFFFCEDVEEDSNIYFVPVFQKGCFDDYGGGVGSFWYEVVWGFLL